MKEVQKGRSKKGGQKEGIQSKEEKLAMGRSGLAA